MKTSQHGDHLTQVTRLWVMNMYLVREEDGLTLIDTGMSGSADSILQAAAALGEPIQWCCGSCAAGMSCRMTELGGI